MPHIHELIDFCAETYIVYNEKVLLRKHDKLGKWLSVGGHIELDENPNQAAVREVKEEVGLNIELYCEEGRNPEFTLHSKSLIPPFYMNIHPITECHQHIALIYFATSTTDQLILSETEVTESCHWFTREEITDTRFGVPEDVQLYALKALEILSK